MTWDKSSPKGCKAYNIKSAAMPTQIIKQASGEDCMKFEPKKKKSSKTDLWSEDIW